MAANGLISCQDEKNVATYVDGLVVKVRRIYVEEVRFGLLILHISATVR